MKKVTLRGSSVYGDTFLDALFKRSFWIFRRAKNEIFYGPLWVIYWMIFLGVGLQFFLIPFSGTEKILVSHYLIQRQFFKTKYSYSELIEFKNDGSLEKDYL